MKFLCNLLLFVFFAFITTPTILFITDDSNTDISCFFNLSEEVEEDCSLSFDELKSIVTIYSFPLFIDFEGFQKNKFSIFEDKKVTSIQQNIYLQPPELV